MSPLVSDNSISTSTYEFDNQRIVCPSVLMLARERARAIRSSNPACELDACLRGTVKLQRAHGGCLGNEKR